jgi:hypothetical protein
MDPSSVQFTIEEYGQFQTLEAQVASLRIWVLFLSVLLAITSLALVLLKVQADRRHRALVEDVGAAVRDALLEHFAAYRETMAQLDREAAVYAAKIGERLAETGAQVGELRAKVKELTDALN